MNNGIIPSIGLSGLFVLSRELDSIYKKDVPYTVKAARRMEEIIKSGEDVFADFYEPLGYDVTRVAEDSMVNACVISLVSNTGNWIHVPSTSIISMPDESGIRYTAMGIGLDIGPIEDSYDLEPLKAKMQEIVMDYLGVPCTATDMAIGETVQMSYEDHIAVLTARQQARTRSGTDGATIIALSNLVQQLRAKNAELENYIIANKTVLGI